MVKLWLFVVIISAIVGSLALSVMYPWSIGFTVAAAIIWFVFSGFGFMAIADDSKNPDESMSDWALFTLVVLFFGCVCYFVGHYSIDFPNVAEYIPITVERK